jgi:flagellar basal-body rod protein FlgF
MAGGAYTALSGLRTRSDQLDRVAADLANVNTAGYKSERVTTVAAERASFNAALQSAVDVTPGPGRLDMRSGTITPTGRDLDFALEGGGFFEVETPQGLRYTRNGQFDRKADGTLITTDGMTVMGQNGPIRLAKGAISVDQDGTVRTGSTVAGKLRVVDFGNYTGLQREEHGRFAAPANTQPQAVAGTTVKNTSLEQSNASVIDRMVQLTEVKRGFEGLQRGISVLFNEIDGRAISELGRR